MLFEHSSYIVSHMVTIAVLDWRSYEHLHQTEEAQDQDDHLQLQGSLTMPSQDCPGVDQKGKYQEDPTSNGGQCVPLCRPLPQGGT